MKKFICILVSVVILTGSLFAQDKTAKKQPQGTAKSAAKTTATKTKKDGTPDKRFKENKTPVAKGPTKKDGTPDMRYKANKKEAKKK